MVRRMAGVSDIVGRVEEALLARTLEGRKLVEPVYDDAGALLFSPGRVIDRGLLELARERGVLERIADAAEPATSDSELEELLSWRRRRQDADHPAG